MIQRIAIAGLGLMGGSLGLAARERAGATRIVGFDPDEGARAAALARGCVDEAVDDSQPPSRTPSWSCCARP